MLFRLKGGSHAQDGKVYKKGDVIETDRNLCAMFRNKFERVYEQELKDTGTELKKPNIPPPVQSPPAGKGDGEAAKLTPEPLPEVSPDADESEKDVKSEHGDNVTAAFPAAEKIGLSVFEKSNWYVVVDNDDSSVLNGKKLRKDAVAGFLKQYQEAPGPEED